MRRPLAFVVCAALSATQTPAIAQSAEEARCTNSVASDPQSRSREYCFGDQPVRGDRDVSTGSVVQGAGHVARVSLIRHRAQFVPEMLKSVENM